MSPVRVFSIHIISLSIALYELYANNHDLGIDKKCEEFPETVQPQPFGSRKLGAVLGLVNTSSAEISGAQGSESIQDEKPPYRTDAMNITLTPKTSTFLK